MAGRGWLVLCGGVLAATLHAAAAAPDAASANALGRINKMRRMAGLGPVTLDPGLSEGCRRHALYLERNRRRPQAQGLLMHREFEGLPGFSPAGRAAAPMSVITRRASLTLAVDAFMATFYHRVPLLRPGLRRVGMGYVGRTAVINVQTGVDVPDEFPVAYPAPGQGFVPAHFPNELPDPIPLGAPRPAGYPITLQFPIEGPEVSAVTAELRDGSGRALRFHLSHPGRPATTFPQMNAVCLIPARPLAPNATYRVTVRGKREGEAFERSWSFSTTHPAATASR